MTSNSTETMKNDQNLPRIPFLVEAKKENPCLPLVSLELLNKYGNKMKQFGAKLNIQSSGTTRYSAECRQLSTVGIIKLARTRLLQFLSEKSSNMVDPYPDNLFNFMNPAGVHAGSSYGSADAVELVLCLLLAAEEFSVQQFDLAKKLLSQCDYFASAAGTPVQKVVHYFSKALGERIDIEEGKIDLERKIVDSDEAFMSLHPATFVSEQVFPLVQAAQFTGIQAILDNVASAKRIHIIDFRIKSGIHWTILLQSLATQNSCPLQRLKITAVGTSKDALEKTERWLSSFAESLNLPFLFKVLLLEMKDVKKDDFDLEPDEVVAVYLEFCLWSLLSSPCSLESLMKVLADINPCVMVVIEMEVDTDTSSFLDRFHEALSFCSACFDCFETCREQDPQYRKIAEEAFLGEMIRNVVTSEDESRIHRYMKIDSWREYFARFDIVEVQPSSLSLYQAGLVLRRFAFRNCCTLKINGKCVIMEWKEIPSVSLSCWKLKCD